jgi:hypothetical protein
MGVTFSDSKQMAADVALMSRRTVASPSSGEWTEHGSIFSIDFVAAQYALV